MRRRIRWILPSLAAVAAIAAVAATAASSQATPGPHPGPRPDAATATPIKHLVVIFQENVSFDHYFGTYPNATNPPGEPKFHAAPNTPSVNGLNDGLLTDNPNLSNPQRLSPAEAAT